MGLLSLALGFSLLRQKTWTVPLLPYWPALGLALVLGLVSYFSNNPWPNQAPLIHFCFVLFLYFLFLQERPKQQNIEKIALLTSSLFFLWFVFVLIFPEVRKTGLTGTHSFTGNPNRTAETFGFCLLILFGRNLKKWWPFFLAGVFYLFVLSSRATLLALVFAVLIGAWQKKSWRKPLIFLLVLIGVGTQMPLDQVTKRVSTPANQRVEKKYDISAFSSASPGGVGHRLSLWQNSLGLLKDYPLLGVGADKFRFHYYPYRNFLNLDKNTRESLSAMTPHNWFLEWPIEMGIPCAFLLFSFLFLWLRKSSYLPWVCYWGVNAFFAFPFKQAFPSLAVMMTLALSTQVKRVIIPKWSRNLLAILFLLFLGHFLAFGFAQVSLKKWSWSEPIMKKACQLRPNSWRTCAHLGELQIKLGIYEEARETLLKILYYDPFNIVALYHLGNLEFTLRNKKNACEYWFIYDYLFSFKSSLSERRKLHCLID